MARLSPLILSLLLPLISATCTPATRLKRQAWHTLSASQKDAYLSAERCLLHLPPTLSLPGATSRFEELQSTHQNQSFAIHFVGAFLPFHRAFVHAHEAALRAECAYTGAQPYWAEERDAGNFAASATWREFGGQADNGCVTQGPFANLETHLGPGYKMSSGCLVRGVNDSLSVFSSRDMVDGCKGLAEWEGFWPCLETANSAPSPHLGGHGGVGGLMFDPVASPGDPLFYLHHAWLDKIWADWQAALLPDRLSAMGGNNVQNESTLPPQFPPRPAGVDLPSGADGDPGNVTTLNHVLNLYGNGPNRTIGEVMDIWDGELCYEYV